LGDAKRIRVVPIDRKAADAAVKRWHYSGRVVNNSQLHLGAFLDGELLGAMQFGPSLDKRKLQGLVEGTPWNGFLELNRMAFSDRLPRNAESRCIAVAMRMMREHAPHVQWVVSFADGAQCGDGTIYRASGFVLTGLRRNTSMWSDGATSVSRTTMTKGAHVAANNGAASTASITAAGFKPIPGFQLRYLYLIDPTARARLTVPVLPFSAIDAAGARMYRGKASSRAGTSTRDGAPVEVGGATPTPALPCLDQ
jgi:hypothetical protein